MEITSHTVVDSPVGPLTLVGRGGTLTGVYFRHHWYRPDPATFGRRDDHGFAAAAGQLAAYFAGGRGTFDLPVHAEGDEFQHAVWRRIAAVPYGETTTYGAIAGDLGDPARARDVGAAAGRNPLGIVVPCHRVVGKDGRLTGYAGGLARKRFLLDLERESSSDGPLTLALGPGAACSLSVNHDVVVSWGSVQPPDAEAWVTGMTTTLDSLARDDVAKQMAALKRRLATEYAEYGEDLVDRVVDEEHSRFAEARVRTFLPILIERSVRARLAT